MVYVLRQRAEGHRSIRVTVDTYGHLVPDGNKVIVNKLAAPVTRALDVTNRNLGTTTSNGRVKLGQR